ncbi:MAG: hypothetical protein HY755_10685 [Nitrospirae bacterium]|nr:hypothetical protein [Nitrospirota bacterium]
MNKRLWLIAVLSAILLLAGFSVAMAVHPTVNVLKADGTAAGTTEAYSPKNTCGGCHFNCSTGAYSTTTSEWCQDYTTKKNCASVACPDYASVATDTVTHNQGYGNSDGKTAFQDWTATSPAHGVSVGKHSQQGRNEEFTSSMRQIWGAPGFASSPGMWGRY